MKDNNDFQKKVFAMVAVFVILLTVFPSKKVKAFDGYGFGPSISEIFDGVKISLQDDMRVIGVALGKVGDKLVTTGSTAVSSVAAVGKTVGVGAVTAVSKATPIAIGLYLGYKLSGGTKLTGTAGEHTLTPEQLSAFSQVLGNKVLQEILAYERANPGATEAQINEFVYQKYGYDFVNNKMVFHGSAVSTMADMIASIPITGSAISQSVSFSAFEIPEFSDVVDVTWDISSTDAVTQAMNKYIAFSIPDTSYVVYVNGIMDTQYYDVPVPTTYSADAYDYSPYVEVFKYVKPAGTSINLGFLSTAVAYVYNTATKQIEFELPTNNDTLYITGNEMLEALAIGTLTHIDNGEFATFRITTRHYLSNDAAQSYADKIDVLVGDIGRDVIGLSDDTVDLSFAQDLFNGMTKDEVESHITGAIGANTAIDMGATDRPFAGVDPVTGEVVLNPGIATTPDIAVPDVSIPGEGTVSIPQLGDMTTGLTNKILPNVFPMVFERFKLATGSNVRREPPVVKIPLLSILRKTSSLGGKSVSQFSGNSYGKITDDYVLIDFADWEKIGVGGSAFSEYLPSGELNLLGLIRTLIGFGFVTTTFFYVWRKITPHKVLN